MSQNEQMTDTVRQILLEEWDPCGVGENPNLRGEYDEYIPFLIGAVRAEDGNVVERVSAELERIESELGVQLGDEVRRKAATRLAKVRPSA